MAFKDKLSISGSIFITASEGFTKELEPNPEENVSAMKRHVTSHLELGIPVNRIGVMKSFGCNYEGDISDTVVQTLQDGMVIANETGAEITLFSLADTMGWYSRIQIEKVIGKVRSVWPNMDISLHLHNTRGLAIANAYAALKMGIDRFDSTVGSLGGRPFAGQPKRTRYLHRRTCIIVRRTWNFNWHRFRPIDRSWKIS